MSAEIYFQADQPFDVLTIADGKDRARQAFARGGHVSQDHGTRGAYSLNLKDWYWENQRSEPTVACELELYDAELTPGYDESIGSADDAYIKQIMAEYEAHCDADEAARDALAFITIGEPKNPDVSMDNVRLASHNRTVAIAGRILQLLDKGEIDKMAAFDLFVHTVPPREKPFIEELAEEIKEEQHSRIYGPHMGYDELPNQDDGIDADLMHQLRGNASRNKCQTLDLDPYADLDYITGLSIRT